ncbi:CRISPR-associated protein Cas5 [Tardisphaera miroshnichenkoae]
MKGFLFDVELMWGYATRLAGMAKSAPSFRFPPPTTILGAIAFSYARRNGYGEERSYETLSELAAGTLALSYRPLNSQAISFQDINRILAIRTSGGESYPSIERPYASFDAPATGKTLLSYVGEGDGVPSLRGVIVVKDSLDIRADDIWGVYRIGSKEGLACVTRVVQCNPSVTPRRVITRYMFPKMPAIEILDIQGETYEESYVPVPYTEIDSGGTTHSEGGERRNRGLPDSITSLVIGSRVIPHVQVLPDAYGGRAQAELVLNKPYVGYSCEGEVVIGIEDSD